MQRPADRRVKTPQRGLPLMLAALWACLGFQPCAIAAASGDGTCPHGAGAAAQAMPGHHAHGHAPAAPDCDSAGSTCCVAESASSGIRPGVLKADDGGEPDVLPAPEPLDFKPQPTAPPERRDKSVQPPDRGRALHVLYCVYLD